MVQKNILIRILSTGGQDSVLRPFFGLAKGKGSKKAKKIELSQTIIFLYFTSLVGSDDEIISSFTKIC